jgi:hypothetical protein
MEEQPILHVWVNHDNDLIDLTITMVKSVRGKKAVKPTSEVIHTNKKHPFLTMEKGFLPVGQMKLGMHVAEADGQMGVITVWKVVPGVKTMYNLEIARDHTFTVGAGQWIVHNSCLPDSFVNNTDELPQSPTFRYPGYLKGHFTDHGSEVGASTEEEYLSKAQSFLGGAPKDGVAQGVNGNLYYRYNINTGEYGIVNTRGTIVTYYNISNKADPWGYFRKQFP